VGDCESSPVKLPPLALNLHIICQVKWYEWGQASLIVVIELNNDNKRSLTPFMGLKIREKARWNDLFKGQAGMYLFTV
jgi:hypothetical protein